MKYYVDIQLLDKPFAKMWNIYISDGDPPPELSSMYRYTYNSLDELRKSMENDVVDQVRIFTEPELPQSYVAEVEALVLETDEKKKGSKHGKSAPEEVR